MRDIVLTVQGELDAGYLEGKTFQIHVLPGNKLLLYPVTLPAGGRCPVIVKDEQCGKQAGHEGKHMWLNGD